MKAIDSIVFKIKNTITVAKEFYFYQENLIQITLHKKVQFATGLDYFFMNERRSIGNPKE
ncbi:hypothetical protein AM500_14150 [Bacillus sp. FJAT-18017]|nr:hypothetical protein AM500_14150 [Bacillus sp. FJAT-18017]